MKYFILIIFVLFANPVFSATPAIENAGFVQSNIWYSKDPFYAGDKVRIYTVIFNGSAYDLSGTVEFLDNGVFVGKADFALASGGRVRDLWVDWKATEGKHTINARFANVVSDGPNGKHAAVLGSNEAGKSERVVELDPIAKAAAAKIEEAKAEEARARTTAKVENVVQLVGESIPAPVKEGVFLGIGTIEEFRVGEAYSLKLAKEKKQKEIEVIKADEEKTLANKNKTVVSQTDAMLNTAEKPFAYVLLALFTVGQYIFEWKILFYGVGIYLIYRLIKWIVGKIRNRG